MHLVRLIIIPAVTLVADQVTKYYVMKEMSPYQSIPVVDGFFNLTFVMNPGAAFGFLSGSSEQFRVPFFLTVSAIAIAVVILFYLQAARDDLLLQIGLALILGGALGNLIDRIRFHAVVDFLDFYFKGYHWPAFNVADSAITVGVAFLILETLLGARKRPGEVA
ncbi:MAG: signal peptidase II [bacterium]|nr:signal peptidase II [bacterium]